MDRWSVSRRITLRESLFCLMTICFTDFAPGGVHVFGEFARRELTDGVSPIFPHSVAARAVSGLQPPRHPLLQSGDASFQVLESCFGHGLSTVGWFQLEVYHTHCSAPTCTAPESCHEHSETTFQTT